MHHPTYYILNFAIDGYLESLASEEAKDAVVTITSKKPIFGQPVRFITIIYKNDLSSYEIIEPQFLFKELKDREPVFENLSRKNGIHRHPLVRIRKRVKNEVK